MDAGVISDPLGSQRLLHLSLLLFGLASTCCGLAWSPFALIGFRVLQGVGSAIIIPTSLSIPKHTSSDEPKKSARAVPS
ncbi:MFS transporter [Mucilaginibacter pocheonensis]|uniref:MFS transporter n=1 Tax=Mucilaginibacter pocheonensis TaxID=398050 RepID=UPI0035B50437